jgi:predicted HTH transcriptional regulator
METSKLLDIIKSGETSANELVKPQVYITTEIVSVDGDDGEAPSKKVLIVCVDEGYAKPYKDNSGVIWIKQGPDKRKLTDNNEIMRLFQQSGLLFADEMEVFETSIDDIDELHFSNYFRKEFLETWEQKGLTYEEALKAKRVLRNNRVTLAGLLFFGKEPQNITPAFTIKAVSFFGNELAGDMYRTKPADFKGTIPMLFKQGMDFFRSHLRHAQKGQDFNSIGILEISEAALVELVQNALVHRDYFKNAPVRLFIFDDRVEIISPGKLPNALTVEEIKYGNPIIRNHQIALFSSHTIPYSGLGSGLKRALKEQPNIELINDEPGNQFIVKIPREPKD